MAVLRSHGHVFVIASSQNAVDKLSRVSFSPARVSARSIDAAFCEFERLQEDQADFVFRPRLTRSYWYRFDIHQANGAFVSFVPYSVEIAGATRRSGAVVSPNPSRSRAVVDLYLAGIPAAGPVEVTAELFDLQGRVLRTLHRGPLGRSVTRIEWDGRDCEGKAGRHPLRPASAPSAALTRVLSCPRTLLWLRTRSRQNP